MNQTFDDDTPVDVIRLCIWVLAATYERPRARKWRPVVVRS